MKEKIGPLAPQPLPRKKIISAIAVFVVCALMVIIITTQTDINADRDMGLKDALLLLVFLGASSCGLSSPALLKSKSIFFFLETWCRVMLAFAIAALFYIALGRTLSAS